MTGRGRKVRQFLDGSAWHACGNFESHKLFAHTHLEFAASISFPSNPCHHCDVGSRACRVYSQASRLVRRDRDGRSRSAEGGLRRSIKTVRVRTTPRAACSCYIPQTDCSLSRCPALAFPDHPCFLPHISPLYPLRCSSCVNLPPD